MSDMNKLGSVSGHLAKPAGKGLWSALIVIQVSRPRASLTASRPRSG
jgi:hypothetical protein